ncbi:MAG: SpoIIE family protein phosphatase [Helicobacteraceae bacterium]|nr:SpoIIE family protein phosphatase [Helicobacteraceae bacterium]
MRTETDLLQNLEEAKELLQKKLDETTKELEKEKYLRQSMLNSQKNLILTYNGHHLLEANQAFFEFYKIKNVEEFFEKYGECIADTFNTNVSKGYLQKIMDEEHYIDYLRRQSDKVTRVKISRDGEEHIFTVELTVLIVDTKDLSIITFTNITETEKSKVLMQIQHQEIKDSVEYASMIQSAILPATVSLGKYFKEYFVTWRPKDTVGGDIWLLNDLRNEEECLLFFIDCTGHGISGAFVTMIVKSIEKEILSILRNKEDMEVSPAWIMGYFNKTMKTLLKQEDKDSLTNVGWDGGIIYYNKKDKLLKFAGAETPLFYMDIQGELHTVKGNRKSVGYKNCEAEYEYKETIINVEEGMKFYCTTDGYLDQTGGEKGFSFGKKRFTNIIKEYYSEPMSELQSALMVEMMTYQDMVLDNEQRDDQTVIAFEIGS